MRGEGPLCHPWTRTWCVGGGVLKLSLFYSVSVHREKIILYVSHVLLHIELYNICLYKMFNFNYLYGCILVLIYNFFNYTSLITCNTTHFICIMFHKLAMYTKYFRSNYTFGEILQKTSKFFILVSAYIE